MQDLKSVGLFMKPNQVFSKIFHLRTANLISITQVLILTKILVYDRNYMQADPEHIDQ